MKILLVAGARPNFVKIAPILREIRRHEILHPMLVHTGQHYDPSLSDHFFKDLEIPTADVNLEVGSGSHAAQTAELLLRLEPILLRERPDMTLVVGDVNSTLAAALAAVKLGIRVAHVEAGLRSGDRSMPEEINRVMVDAVADLLFVTELSGYQNLLKEGIGVEKIHFVGNVMIDALEASRGRWTRAAVREDLGLAAGRRYAVVTLHRPSNVDDPESLSRILRALGAVAERLPVIFPVHPRTRARLEPRAGLLWRHPGSRRPMPDSGLVCIEPLGYLDCIALMSGASLVLTDSGGVQEETTILGVPCLTLRESTERPVTVGQGTNRVIGTLPSRIVRESLRALTNPPAPPAPPPLWDGRAAGRIVKVLIEESRGHEVAA